MNDIRLVCLCGSLRRESFNMMVLRKALASLPAGCVAEPLYWNDVPPFNADDMDMGLPPSVQHVREKIRDADGVFIATPEYNFSIPGMFKNMLDWVSRGADQPFARKPVAIASATTGPLGGARVQYDMRRAMLFMDALVLQKPEVYVGNVASKFNAQGDCTDEATGRFLTDQMAEFARWIGQTRRMRDV
jgi:chromate reductase, NAD(P)H dehydrogenase (quinone)